MLPETLRHHLFFIEGGALAVENALKAAFDWKARKNLAAGRADAGSQVLHFRDAFHGRSGYTLSLTNTDPVKIEYFPKFPWPRVEQSGAALPGRRARARRRAPRRGAVARRDPTRVRASNPHDIAAIIIEPIQAEGGDNHFRPEFLRALRQIADENELLLIFDEVQTGFGTTGRWWCFEHFGVEPDIIAFGKKTQVCGMAATRRLDEVDNVFQVPSRINSTWGGNLVDMVRCRRIIEVDRAGATARERHRGGAAAAVRPRAPRRAAARSWSRTRAAAASSSPSTCPTPPRAIARCAALHREHLLALPTGRRGIRFRPPLILRDVEADEGLERCERGLRAL